MSANLGDIDIVSAHQPLQLVDQGLRQAGGGVRKINFELDVVFVNQEGKPVMTGARDEDVVQPPYPPDVLALIPAGIDGDRDASGLLIQVGQGFGFGH